MLLLLVRLLCCAVNPDKICIYIHRYKKLGLDQPTWEKKRLQGTSSCSGTNMLHARGTLQDYHQQPLGDGKNIESENAEGMSEAETDHSD